MTAPAPRGACPSLSAPMATGDGLLVRLTLAESLAPAALAGLAEAADRYGNGLVEVTRRGSLQIRGLSEGSLPGLAAAVTALGLGGAPGPVVLAGPLAGVDPAEIADPRPLAAALRRGAAGLALHPKVSVIVDGGGALPLDAVAADVRLRAEAGGWRVLAGERSVGRVSAAEAERMALGLLARLAATGGRGRDLDLSPGGGAPQPPAQPPEAVGRFPLADGTVARGIALPFGLCTAATLAALADAAEGTPLRPSPGGALVAIGLAPAAEKALVAAAARLGLVTSAGDPRRAITACAGWPACGSGHLATRALATRMAGRLPDGIRLHLSGCAKMCGRPAGRLVTVVGTPGGPEIAGDGPVPEVAAALGRAMAEGPL